MYEGNFFLNNVNKNKDQLNFDREIENKERAFYSGSIGYRGMIDFLEESEPVESSALEKKELLLNLYQGMRSHEEINIDAVRFRLALSESRKSAKEYKKITNQEVQEAFANCEESQRLEENEKKAVDFYEKALENWEDTFYVKRHHLETLIYDIKYRQAKRIVAENERTDSLNRLKSLGRSIAKDIEDKGQRAEFQLVHLINEWAENQGKGHLIEAYSALPLDDHKEKVDVEIVTGKETLNINLKSYKNSSYIVDFNEALLNEEKDKIKGNRINIVVLDSENLQEVWRLMGDREQTDSNKRRIKKLMGEIIGKIDNDFLAEVLNFSQSKTSEKSCPMTRKELIAKHCHVQNLIRWGYLEESEVGNPDAIVASKGKLEKDLTDDKVFRRLREDV